MLEAFLPLLAALGKLSQPVKMGVLPVRNILKQGHSSFYNSADVSSEAALLSLGPEELEGQYLSVRAYTHP